jgi:hypothetical protein
LAAAAWQRGFAAAPRKAFVADGQDANWTVCRKHFSHYTPILDFIHAICYVFAGAMAGRPASESWPVYCQWAQWVWSGQIPLVIEALQVRQQELGSPEKDESEESPRSKVADALRYLENQKSRMHYDQYRREGLPITSSHITIASPRGPLDNYLAIRSVARLSDKMGRLVRPSRQRGRLPGGDSGPFDSGWRGSVSRASTS